MEEPIKDRCVSAELVDTEGNMKFIVDVSMRIPKQMTTKPLWDYTIMELGKLYKELHPESEEE